MVQWHVCDIQENRGHILTVPRISHPAIVSSIMGSLGWVCWGPTDAPGCEVEFRQYYRLG